MGDRPSTGKHTVLIDGLKTAADFLLDTEHRQLLVFDMVSGTPIFLPRTIRTPDKTSRSGVASRAATGLVAF